MAAAAASTPKEMNTLDREQLNWLFTEKFKEFQSHDPATGKVAQSIAEKKIGEREEGGACKN